MNVKVSNQKFTLSKACLCEIKYLSEGVLTYMRPEALNPKVKHEINLKWRQLF